MKFLAIISELYYMVTGQSETVDYDDFYRRSYRKAERLLEAGCVFSDFGTRRRLSFRAEDTLVKAMTDCAASRDWAGLSPGQATFILQ